MKVFFQKYSYSTVKMFVNQFAISIFGTVLAMATSAAQNDVLTVIVSVFAIVFYLFLIYTMTWEIGATDKISVDYGKKEYKPFTGLWMSLVANIPNFVFAVVYSIGYPFMATQKWAGTTCYISRLLTVICEGMYLGLTMTVSVGGNALNHYWWTYFLITVPALITAWVAYYLGHKDFRFFAFITDKNAEKKK